MKKFEKHHLIVGVVALVVGIGIGYFIPHGGAAMRGSFAQNGTFTHNGTGGFAMRGANGASALSGTIAQVSSGSLTLDTRDGSSHVVLLTPETSVSKSVTGTTTDLTVGSAVMIAGTQNSDGSLSAMSVTIRPAGAPGTNAPMIPAKQ